MPNWCTTQITINSDYNRLKMLEKRINEWTSKNYKENGFGLDWLGNIVGNSQIGTVDENEETNLRCRGTMTYMDNLGEQLVINTETAWVPMLKMWVKLVEKYIPEAELIYEAEECGCGLQCTNDPRYAGKYVIDAWDVEDVESDYEASEEEVVSLLQKLSQTVITDVNRLLDILSDSHYASGMSIRKWEFKEIDEWD